MMKRKFWYATSALLLLFASYSCRDGTAGSDGGSLRLPDVNMLFENYEQLDSTKAYSDFAEKLVEANRDLQASELYVEAAALYHQAGDDEEVITLLHKAIDRGLANPKILAKFQGLEDPLTSRDGKRLKKRLDSINKKLRQVSHFGLEMESMHQFWGYFERAKKDTANAKAIFKEFIFEGPRELRDFYVVRYNSLDNMYGQMINAAPNYYSYLREQFNPDSLNALKSKTTQWMRNFKKYYPQAVFPKVFVVPGILNSGGTATEMGMFVGGDMYGRSESMPTDGLTDWQKGAIMKFSDLPGLTIHELMHFQQSYKDTLNANTVLAGIIGEGVCDFLVELSSGETLDNSNLRYLQNPENRERILNDLRKELFIEDNSNWLYNGGAIEDRPHDLGYTMGYLISKSYYENHENKQKAVNELLNTDNFIKILKGSKFGYLLN
ncbi:MAG TPA: DUF2268 domain-containing putative Zn-dependent protease [Eudoraea sp.]|nr:DUF2268 domain-containing putative Zn-dependent protease [Eudoraea sp.]